MIVFHVPSIIFNFSLFIDIYAHTGKAGIEWSALARPPRGRPRDQDDAEVLVKAKEIDPEREQYLADMRHREGRKKKRKLSVEEKGWTSAGWGGRSLGPPDPIPGGMWTA